MGRLKGNWEPNPSVLPAPIKSILFKFTQVDNKEQVCFAVREGAAFSYLITFL